MFVPGKFCRLAKYLQIQLHPYLSQWHKTFFLSSLMLHENKLVRFSVASFAGWLSTCKYSYSHTLVNILIIFFITNAKENSVCKWHIFAGQSNTCKYNQSQIVVNAIKLFYPLLTLARQAGGFVTSNLCRQVK